MTNPSGRSLCPVDAPGSSNRPLDHRANCSISGIEQGNASGGVNCVKGLPIRAYSQPCKTLLFQVLVLHLERCGVDHPDAMQLYYIEQALIRREHCSFI